MDMYNSERKVVYTLFYDLYAILLYILIEVGVV